MLQSLVTLAANDTTWSESITKFRNTESQVVRVNKSIAENGTSSITEQSLDSVNTLAATSFISILLGIYILIALSVYSWKVNHGRAQLPGRQTSKTSSLMRKTAYLTVVINILSSSCHLMSVMLILVENLQFCDITMKIYFVLANLTNIGVYIFLWLRQRTLYSNPSMNHLTTPCTRFLSFVSFAFIVVIAIVNPIVYCSTQTFELGQYTCRSTGNNVTKQYYWITLAVTTLSFHVILLSLFVYPLANHHSAVRKSLKNSTAKRKRPQNMLDVIRRAFSLALVCVVSDVLVVVVNAADFQENSIVPHVASDGNLLLNICCIILTFVDWRERLFVCLRLGYTQSALIKQSSMSQNTRERSAAASAAAIAGEISQDERCSTISSRRLSPPTSGIRGDRLSLPSVTF